MSVGGDRCDVVGLGWVFCVSFFFLLVLLDGKSSCCGLHKFVAQFFLRIAIFSDVAENAMAEEQTKTQQQTTSIVPLII